MLKKPYIYTKTTEIEYLDMDTHLHENHHQLIFMLKGTLHVKIDDKQYFLPERFIGLIPAKKPHNLQSRNEMVKLFLLYFPSSIKLEEALLLGSNDFVLTNLLYLSQHQEKIEDTKHPSVYNFACAFLEMLIEMDCLRSLPLKGLIAPKNERLSKVLNFIDTHYRDQLSLAIVAEKFGFSVRNLTRLFRKESISFNNYLNHIRIIHAIELFTDHHESIEKVAYTVGYNTLSNFSRTFKRFTGQSPRSFISTNKNQVFK